MKRMKMFPAMPIVLLALLSSCGRLIDWGKGNFYQGEDVVLYDENIKPFMKSVTIYDQLQTKASFDIMWLSDTVKMAYAQLHIKRMGESESRQNAFLRRQLEENRHYITFYLLSTHDVKLGTPESYWSLFLQVNGKDYQPFEVKEVELPTEYQEFFGSKWNRFKVPYRVKFRLNDENDEPIISDAMQAMSFFVRSAEKEHAFIWNVHDPEMAPRPIVIPDEDTPTVRR